MTFDQTRREFLTSLLASPAAAMLPDWVQPVDASALDGPYGIQIHPIELHHWYVENLAHNGRFVIKEMRADG